MLKKNFPTVISEGIGKCTKAMTIFQSKQNGVPVFKPKLSVPYVVVEHINKELAKLESLVDQPTIILSRLQLFIQITS